MAVENSGNSDGCDVTHGYEIKGKLEAAGECAMADRGEL